MAKLLRLVKAGHNGNSLTQTVLSVVELTSTQGEIGNNELLPYICPFYVK